MKQLFRWGLLWLFLLVSGVAHAVTELVEIYYLPLSEAENAVRTQLSPTGSVSAMPSRRLLIIQDDTVHIEKARGLLRQLDVRPVQYRASLVITQVESRSSRSAGLDATLPGGWVRLRVASQRDAVNDRRHYNLRLQSGKPGFIEAGEVVPVTTRQRSWLAGYGIEESTTLMSVTGGFEVLLRPVGDDQVQVQIHPWLQRLTGPSRQLGQAEVRIDLGAPSPGGVSGRMHSAPVAGETGRIAVAEADTELTVPLGSDVGIAAVGSDAKMFGEALLASHSATGNRQLMIRLRVERAR